MPSLPNLNFFHSVSELMKQYHTVELKIKIGAEATEALQREFAILRSEVADLKAKVGALEESRNTLRAEMERVKAETIGELRAVKAETVAELKVLQTRYEADLYRRFLDMEATLKQRSLDAKAKQIDE